MRRAHDVRKRLRREYLVALGCGLATAVAAGSMMLLIERIHPREAVELIEALMPTARFFAFAMLSGSGTILVLMLTLFSLSYGSPARLRAQHYVRIKRLAAVDVVALVGATLFMLLLISNVPLQQADAVPEHAFQWIYRLIVGFSATLGGTIIGVMVMLYQTVRDIIREIGLRQPLGLGEP